MDRVVQEQPLSVLAEAGVILSPSARTGLADLAPEAKVGQTVGCSTFTRGAKPATRRVADGERMNPGEKDGEPTPGLQFGLQFTAVRAGSVEYARRVSPAARTAMNPYELAPLKLLNPRAFAGRAASAEPEVALARAILVQWCRP